ncbi:MAG: MerR family transcriptional regulator [Emergencia sp.]
MVKIKDEYKISEAADFLGVSADTIRYYDKQQILCPRKDESTNYRYYTWGDLISLDHILRLKRISFPLQEIGHMVNEYSLDETLNVMLAHEQELEKQLEELTLARKMLRSYIMNFEEIFRKEGELRFEMSPMMICSRIDREVNRIFEDFQKLTSSQLPLFTLMAPVRLEPGQEELPYEEYLEKIRNREECFITIIDDGELSRSRLVKENSEITIMPSRLCLHGIRKIEHRQEHVATLELLQYAWKNGYEANGPLIVRSLLYLKNGKSVETDYYDMYLPVTKKG